MDLVYDPQKGIWKKAYKVEIFFDSKEQRDKFEKALNSGGLEPARPRGRWVDGRCTNCGEQAEVQSIGFNCTGGTRVNYKHTNFCKNCGAVMNSIAADFLNSNGVTALHWIPATERLPEIPEGRTENPNPVFFIVKGQEKIEAGFYGKNGTWRDSYFRPYRNIREGYDSTDVLCWMWQSVLPEPPKEDAK